MKDWQHGYELDYLLEFVDDIYQKVFCMKVNSLLYKFDMLGDFQIKTNPDDL